MLNKTLVLYNTEEKKKERFVRHKNEKMIKKSLPLMHRIELQQAMDFWFQQSFSKCTIEFFLKWLLLNSLNSVNHNKIQK